MSKGRRERGDGTVFYVPSRNRWAVEFTLAEGKKPRRFFLTEKDAKKYAKDTAAKMHIGIQPVPSSPTLEAYMSDWLETVIRANRAESTYVQYRMMAKRHIFPALGRMRVNEIQRTHVQKLLNSVATKKKQRPIRNGEARQSPEPMSRNTVRIIKAVLSSCLAMAVKDQLVYQNVAESAELPTTQSRPATALSREQAAALLETLSTSPVDNLLAFLLLTGCRLAEGHGVRWCDMSEELSDVWIRGQFKRESAGLKYSETTKTHRARHIHLVPELTQRLKHLRDEQRNNQLEDPDDLVFISESGNRFDPKTVRTRLARLCQTLGLPKTKVHELRHTAATLMAQVTGDIHAVQKVLGHSQVALTANLYAHATDELTARALKGLGESLSQTRSRTDIEAS